MELPNYRLPSPKSVGLLMWDKARTSYPRLHGHFAATIVIWFLQTFDTRLNVVADSSASMLAGLGRIIAPSSRPGLYGLARLHGPDHRLRPRSGGQHHGRADRHQCCGIGHGAGVYFHSAERVQFPDRLPAVHALCSGHRCSAPGNEFRTGRTVGCLCPMRRYLGVCRHWCSKWAVCCVVPPWDLPIG